MREDKQRNKSTDRRTVLGVAGGMLTAGLVGARTVAANGNREETERVTTAGGTEVDRNEIRFARNELPHYLEGTILDGGSRVVVTESGDPPTWLSAAEYDVALTHREESRIRGEAIKRYIDEYGVDPSASKVQLIQNRPYTNEEARQLVASGNAHAGTVETEVSTTASSPHAIDGQIRVHVFEASNSEHQPSESWQDQTDEAWDRFEQFGVETTRGFYYGFWDPSGTGDSSSDMLAHLRDNQSSIQDDANEIVSGWVDYADNNGRAYRNGFYSVNATSASGMDWPHDSIFQHEISHNFNAEDQGTWGYEHEWCIMNYEYAYRGTEIWCDDCGSTVDSNIS